MGRRQDSSSDPWQYFIYEDLNESGTLDSGEPEYEVVGSEDSDWDGLTNEQEFIYGSSPYNPDSDYDGVTDGDEVNTLGGPNSGFDPNLWDTDNDGFSDYDETYGSFLVNYSEVGPGASYFDWDGDGYYNPWDSHPLSSAYYSDWDNNGYNAGDDPPPMEEPPPAEDNDGDGYSDNNDSHPSSSWLWDDWNNNGISDSQEGGSNDNDNDGVPDVSDSHPYNGGLWNDWNYDGYNDDTSDDSDLDGHPNSNDSHPYDSQLWADWNYDGYNDDSGPPMPESDFDADGYPDSMDSHSSDPYRWSDWNENGYNDESEPPDFDGDGRIGIYDSHPNNSLLWNDSDGDYQNDEFESDEDLDGDGWTNEYDSHDNDARYKNDWDYDGLEAEVEASLGTDPTNSDTDGDGLNDGDEYLTLHTDPFLRDTDGDGLTDFEEIHIQPTSNPLNKHSRSQAMGMGDLFTDWQFSSIASDSDEDGLPDPVEIIYGLNPVDPSDAEGDLDADGITNLEEYEAGSSLWGNSDAYDADLDGITDLQENMISLKYPGTLNRFDPTDATEDPDGDGLLNYEELALDLDIMDADSSTAALDTHTGTQPSPDMIYAQTHGHPAWQMPVAKGDVDGDGMPDVWEHHYRVRGGLSGLDLRDATDWSGDLDGDLLNNRTEVRTYRNPLIPDQIPSPVPIWNYNPGSSVTSPYVPQIPSSLSAGTAGNFSLQDLVISSQDPPPSSIPIYEARSIQYEQGETGLKPFAEGRIATATGRSVSGPMACSPSGGDPTFPGQRCACSTHGTEDRFVAVDGSDGGYEYKVWIAGEETVDESDDVFYWASGGDYNIYWQTDPTVSCDDTPPASNNSSNSSGSYASGVAEVRVRFANPLSAGDGPKSYDVKITRRDNGGDPVITSTVLTVPVGSSESNIVSASTSQLSQGSSVTVEILDGELPEVQFNVAPNDSAGPRYRKVGLNGVPIPDAKPQVQDESGELPEETYIDAYLAQLRHSVTDVYTHEESSLLPLQVRRDITPASWNDRSGLLPEELPYQPFGPGWSSNLCSYVHFTKGAGGYTADVVDEMGASQHYTLPNNTFMWLHDRQEFTDIKSFLNIFTATSTQGGNEFYLISLQKKFGVTCFYEMVPHALLNQKISTDRYYGSDQSVTHTYARLQKVEDRWGNQLIYEYTGASLIPHTIRDPHRPGRQITIEQENGRVKKIRSPNGNDISYGYESKPYMHRRFQSCSVLVLKTVTRGGHTVTYDQKIDSEIENHPGGRSTTHLYLDLTGITDERGNTYSFTHDFNTTIYYRTELGKFRQYGLPLKLSRVESPITGAVNISNARIVDPTSSISAALPVSTSFTYTHEGTTRQYSYLFTNPYNTTVQGNILAAPSSDPMVFSFLNMTITSPDNGTETYTFNPTANMALSQVRDRNGNLTTFRYTDMAVPMNAIATSSFPFYDDPTQEINALGQVKYMTYDAHTRILKSVTDSRKVKTFYEIDQRTLNGKIHGRRLSESVSAIGLRGGKLESFAYEHPIFAGMVTERTLTKNVQDPTAVTPDICPPLITRYSLNPNTETTGWWLMQTETQSVNEEEASTLTIRDFEGNKRSVTDARGYTTKFDYDGSNRLTSVQYPDGTSKSLFYDAHGNLTKEVDETGRTAFHEYDALNRRTKTTIDLNGNQVADDRGDGDLVEDTTYNDMNLPVTKTDARGIVTRMEYDAIGRLTRTTVNHGATDPTQILETQLDYKVSNINGGKEAGSSIFDISGFKPVRITDPAGRVTTLKYDNLYRVIEKSGTDAGTVFTTYASNESSARPATVSHPVNAQRLTSFIYDVFGQVTKTTQMDGAVTETFYTHHGQPWKTIDVFGRQTTTRYDAAGRPVEMASPAVDGAQAIVRTGYDLAGNAIWKTDARGNTIYTDYDRRNRPVFVNMPEVYDAQDGQMRRPVIETRYDNAGRETVTVDPLGRETTKVYDNAGRLVKTIDSMGNQTILELDAGGQIKTTTNPKGQVVTNLYDALGRLEQTTDHQGIITKFEYDKAGNRTKVTDGEEHVTTFEYDGQNRLTKQIFEGSLTAVGTAANDTWTYAYDAAVKLSQTDPQGRVTSYTYDALDRLKTVVTPASGSVPANTRTFVYDLAGRITSVTESSDLTATVAYSYDELGRMISETSRGLTHTYHYDLAGNRTEALYADGRKTVSSYDAINRPESLEEGPIADFETHKKTTLYGYDLAGRALTLTSGNGQTTLNQYDSLGRLTGRTLHQSYPVTAENKQAEFAWHHDVLGNVTQQVEQWYGTGIARLRTTDMTYDGANRLTAETVQETAAQTVTTTYGYDDANNRTSKEVILSGSGTAPGVEAGHWTYHYNEANQLTRTEKRAAEGSPLLSATTYLYDAQGNRVQRASSDNHTASAAATIQGVTLTAATPGLSGNALSVALANGGPGQTEPTVNVNSNQVGITLAMDAGGKASASQQSLTYTASEVGTAGNNLNVRLEKAGVGEELEAFLQDHEVVVKLATDQGSPDTLVNQGITYTAVHAPEDAPPVSVSLIAEAPDQDAGITIEENEVRVQLATDAGEAAQVISQGLTYDAKAEGPTGNALKLHLKPNDEGSALALDTVTENAAVVLLEQTGGTRAALSLPEISYQAQDIGEAGNDITIVHALNDAAEAETTATVSGNTVTLNLAQSPGDHASITWQGITFTAREPGVAGNQISISIGDPVEDGQPIWAGVDGNHISVILSRQSEEPFDISDAYSVASAIQSVADHLVEVSGGSSGQVSGDSFSLSGGGENRAITATYGDVMAAVAANPQAAALIRVESGDGNPLSTGTYSLEEGTEAAIETTPAQLLSFLQSQESLLPFSVSGTGSTSTQVQPGTLTFAGGGRDFAITSTITSIVTELSTHSGVQQLLTVSGSGTTTLNPMESTALTGGTARASVSTAGEVVAAIQALDQPSSPAPLTASVSSGDTPGAVVHPAVVELTGGVDPASTTSVTQLVTFINTALATQGLITASGSGETILTATSSAISLTGGGPQTTATGTTTYTWDVLGRLKGVALPSGPSYSYQYDYRTRRIATQQAAHESQAAKYTAIVFSGGLSLAEYESGTAITTPSSPAASTVRYLRGPDMGGGVGGLLSSRRVGVTKYNLSNGRGDVVAQSDETATLTWTASYEAYGKRTKETGENQDKQRANTKDEDPTGLLNEGFRYRDIETGVWLSRDPAGFVDGPNLYAYVKQNPWTSWDPLGLDDTNPGTAIAKAQQEKIDLVRELGHDDIADAQQRLLDDGKSMAASTAQAMDAAVSMTPLGSANEAIFGENAMGETLTWDERGMAAFSAVPPGKFLDKMHDILGAGARATVGRAEELVEVAVKKSGPGAASAFDEAFAANRKFVPSQKHGKVEYSVGGKVVNAGPTNGQEALNFSFELSPNSTRRIGVDTANNEIVIFDRTGNTIRNGEVIGGDYHGHIRTYDQLNQTMKNTLQANGISIGKNGSVKLDPNFWGD